MGSPTVAVSLGPFSVNVPFESLVRMPLIVIVLAPEPPLPLVVIVPELLTSPLTVSEDPFSRSINRDGPPTFSRLPVIDKLDPLESRICPALVELAPAVTVLPPVRFKGPVWAYLSASLIMRVCLTPPSVSSEVKPLGSPPIVSELMVVLPASRVTTSLSTPE